MEKTKLGISVGLMGAILWLVCYYSGYIGALLVAGYILIAEKDEWLKKLAVKAVVLMLAFSVAASVIYLLPNLISCINSIVSIFGGSFYLSFISNLATMLATLLDFVEKIVFIILAALAAMHITIPVPVLESFVDKHFEAKAE